MKKSKARNDVFVEKTGKMIDAQDSRDITNPFWQGFRKYLKSIGPDIRSISKEQMSQMFLTYTIDKGS